MWDDGHPLGLCSSVDIIPINRSFSLIQNPKSVIILFKDSYFSLDTSLTKEKKRSEHIKEKPTIAQSVERRTVVVPVIRSLSHWFTVPIRRK